MKVYIIEILNKDHEWTIYQRVCFKNRKDAEKIVKQIKYKVPLITKLKLK